VPVNTRGNVTFNARSDISSVKLMKGMSMLSLSLTVTKGPCVFVTEVKGRAR
jgi:hypothetical protein